jgi:hypothetical protein
MLARMTRCWHHRSAPRLSELCPATTRCRSTHGDKGGPGILAYRGRRSLAPLGVQPGPQAQLSAGYVGPSPIRFRTGPGARSADLPLSPTRSVAKERELVPVPRPDMGSPAWEPCIRPSRPGCVRRRVIPNFPNRVGVSCCQRPRSPAWCCRCQLLVVDGT